MNELAQGLGITLSQGVINGTIWISEIGNPVVINPMDSTLTTSNFGTANGVSPSGSVYGSSNDLEYWRKLVRADAKEFNVTTTVPQVDTVTLFIVYGNSQKTRALGSGERRAVIRDYLENVNRASVDWKDIQRMVEGRKIVGRNLAKEQAQVERVLKNFRLMYGKEPNFKNLKEDLAWNTLMYRIRFERDLVKERNGITRFRSLYRRTPRTPMDWAIVRSLGYVLWR